MAPYLLTKKIQFSPHCHQECLCVEKTTQPLATPIPLALSLGGRLEKFKMEEGERLKNGRSSVRVRVRVCDSVREKLASNVCNAAVRRDTITTSTFCPLPFHFGYHRNRGGYFKGLRFAESSAEGRGMPSFAGTFPWWRGGLGPGYVK